MIYNNQLPSCKDPETRENCYVESRAVATQRRAKERHCEEPETGNWLDSSFVHYFMIKYVMDERGAQP